MLKSWKKFCLAAAAALAVLLVAGALYKAMADRRYYDGYDAALALDPVVRGKEAREGYTRVDFTYQSLPGMMVPTLLALPLDGKAPMPCIIFLHGIGQSKGFLDDIAKYYTAKGFAIACFDQYTRGERKLTTKNPFLQLTGLRRRAALNVIDTRRLVDYLQTRDDIAKDRIYLVGASFGAITGCNAVAYEPRIRAAVLTYGGGDLGLLLSSDAAKQELGIWHTPVRMIAEYVTAPAEPLRNVARIAPRPVLFQNGDHDRLIPLDAAKALVNAAGEPKKFTIYDSDHVGVDEQQTIQVLEDSVEWLQEQDKTVTPADPRRVASPLLSAPSASAVSTARAAS